MEVTKEISSFILERIGGNLAVNKATGEIVYTDAFFTSIYGDLMGKQAKEELSWLEECPALSEEGKAVEWECLDMMTKKYYKVNSGLTTVEGVTLEIHILDDISEYMSLNRDITKYMAFFKKLSAFQSVVLSKLSETVYELLPMLCDYFKAERAVYLLQREQNLDITTYASKQYNNDRIDLGKGNISIFETKKAEEIAVGSMTEEMKKVFVENGSTEADSFVILTSGDVSGQRFAVILEAGKKLDRDSFKESALVEVVRMYVENGILHEKLVYNSEHDSLTGLYNKGKYLAMQEDTYRNLDSIAIYNLDVNNLKKMNDTYGHEMGDKLLIKAANSIRKVTTNMIHGYRMGGDEYLMIACNVSEEEATTIKNRWEEELAKLNTLDDGIDCVIACGLVWGSQGYDYDAMFKEADALMYEDKKAKKKPGEEIR
ncbi:MAG: GGDEF domain-containing protein [Lachnospiraceae bacterium]|nr:GGDEF domain-containing protein [Lachnospiraceae bacterium]